MKRIGLFRVCVTSVHIKSWVRFGYGSDYLRCSGQNLLFHFGCRFGYGFGLFGSGVGSVLPGLVAIILQKGQKLWFQLKVLVNARLGST